MKSKINQGLKFTPTFVAPKAKAHEQFKWKKRTAAITTTSGDSVFEQRDVLAPEGWSDTAVNIVAAKYFRKKGDSKKTETSVLELVNRVVDTIVSRGEKEKYFVKAQGQIFSEELKSLILDQRASFNSPVWFNLGLFEKYKQKSSSKNYWYDEQAKKVFHTQALFKPQTSACFIQGVEDSLESIFELIKKESMIFKFGSGSGTNFSKLRSRFETLEQGGTSSGLIRFLEVYDKAAGSIKSGGTTRRAAKMVVINDDHPELLEFIRWKAQEEKKVQALVAQGYSSHFEGEAYQTVSGQNSNNSVSVTDAFMQAVERDKNWSLRARSSGKVVKSLKASEIFLSVAQAAWASADPGLQFKTQINSWHTCPEFGEIESSNPCSEYFFLNETSCNLASLNLLKFLDQKNEFKVREFLTAVRIMTISLDLLIDCSGYPTSELALNAKKFRTLGLGFTGLGAFLMRQGLAYDSEEGRAWASAIMALIHLQATQVSHELASAKGSYPAFTKSKLSHKKVIKKHLQEAKVRQTIWQQILPSEISKELKTLQDHLQELLPKKIKMRNAQLTVLAPTGTISLMMDSETTGIEPFYSLVSYKNLSGGGNIKFVANSVDQALKTLGFTGDQFNQVHQSLLAGNLPTGLDQNIFATANGEGVKLSPEAHLKMMAAVQGFVSGAISKTVNMPASASVNDVAQVYKLAWKLKLKSVAIYRDGSKGSQPITAKPIEEFKDCPICSHSLAAQGACQICLNCGWSSGCSV